MSDFWNSVLEITLSTLRMSTPLILAALGGLISERSGVVNIALEGFMLLGAFTAAAVTYFFSQGNPGFEWALNFSPVLGFLASMLAGGLFAALYGISVIRLRADQIVAGTAMNMLAAGVTPFLCKILDELTSATPTIELAYRFQSFPMIFAWGMAIAIALFFRFASSGLWITFAGEHPQALEAAGVRVLRVRTFAVIASGMLAGAAGASLSIFLSSSFSRNMTAGRGFMALAALIFGKWRPIPAALACVLFGFTEANQIRLQGVVLWGTEPVPVQFIQILPYLVTVLVLAGWVGQSRAPKSLGLPFQSH